MFAGLALLAAMTAPTSTLPFDGSRLVPGDTCFTIELKGKPAGTTWQSVHATQEDGHAAWDITIHQRFADGSFDMRDHLIVDRATLRPLVMESDRGTQATQEGWHRIRLAYTASGVTGTRETASGTVKVDERFDHAVWDGNLWGLTIAALPLKEGASFVIPTWQYDNGPGEFIVRVAGKVVVHAPQGDLAAWDVLAGRTPERLVHYSIGVAPQAELGYAAGPFAQTPGGRCESH